MSLANPVTYDSQAKKDAESGDIYWTNEEIELLKTLDPAFMTNKEKEILGRSAFNESQYWHNTFPNQQTAIGNPEDRKIPWLATTELNPTMVGMGNMLSSTLPHLSTTMPMVTATLGKIVGNGLLPPSFGRGLRPPSYTVTGRGKQRYRSMIKKSRQLTKDLAKSADIPVSKSEVEALFDAYVPRSFYKSLKSKKGKGKISKSTIENAYTMARPALKWLIKKSMNQDAFKPIYSELKSLMKTDTPNVTEGEGIRDVVQKTGRWLVEKGLPKSSTFMKEFVAKYGQSALEKFPLIIGKLIQSFGDTSLPMPIPKTKVIGNGTTGSGTTEKKKFNIQII